MRKKLSMLLCLGSALILASCGCAQSGDTPVSSEPASSGQPESSASVPGSSVLSSSETVSSTSSEAEKIYWTVTFDSMGGSSVASIEVEDGKKAEQPADPTKEGYDFAGWWKDVYCVTPWSFDTAITAPWTLYAKWTPGTTPTSSEILSSEISSSEPVEDKRGHGPEGSVVSEWGLAGSGSLWGSNGWTKDGCVPLYTNPNSATDKGCVLGITFEAGDQFKVTNFDSIWFGYEGVDKADSPANLGLTHFEGVSDGYGGQNFSCKIAGTYDMYINGSGVFWIQAAA